MSTKRKRSEDTEETKNETKGKVMSVCGPISPESLGRTLMHEHIIVNYAQNFAPPTVDQSRTGIGGLSLDEQQSLWQEPVAMDKLGHLCCYYNQNRDNMILSDVDGIAKEVAMIRKFKGGSIVELSVDDIGRNPTALREVSKTSGVNIVMGTGYYLARVHPKEMESLSVDDIAQHLIRDLTVGVKDTGIRAGIIGELGCSTDITSNEIKVLQAAAKAQVATGCSISIHPGYSSSGPKEIMAVLEKAGATLSRVVMGHVDRGILTMDDMIELAGRGVVLEFDQFGWPPSFTHALSYGIDYPSDFVRCSQIRTLIEKGFGQQIVVSHDLAFKTRLTQFGGTGYAYILKNIIPYMLKRGFSDKDVEQIFVKTPARLLTFV